MSSKQHWPNVIEPEMMVILLMDVGSEHVTLNYNNVGLMLADIVDGGPTLNRH